MKRYCRYSMWLCALCVGLSGAVVRAENVAGRAPQASSGEGQQLVQVAPILTPDAVGISPWGIALWCMIFLALAAALAYMVVNIFRRKKTERLRSEQALVKPQLIIHEAYRKKGARKGGS